MHFDEQDHAKVSAAIARAEQGTAGEIIAVTADTSDSYHDVGLHWALLAMLVVLGGFAAFPQCLEALWDRLNGWSTAPTMRELLTVQLFLSVLAFLIVVVAVR